MENIHTALAEFLMTYQPLADWYFNYNEISDKSFNIIPIAGEVYDVEFIEGGGICHYDFAINVFRTIPKAKLLSKKRNQSTEILFDAQNFMLWLDEQNEAGNLPDFGDGIEATEIENLQNMPENAGEDARAGMYKLTFPARIKYLRGAT